MLMSEPMMHDALRSRGSRCTARLNHHLYLYTQSPDNVPFLVCSVPAAMHAHWACHMQVPESTAFQEDLPAAVRARAKAGPRTYSETVRNGARFAERKQ